MAEAVKSDNKNGTDTPPPKINEPSEVDPCIEFKNSSNKSQFLQNTERRLCEKTGLSRIGLYVACVLLILLFVLCIIVLVLAVAWPRIPHHLQYPICEQPACLRAAAQIQENWNSSTSPCENVWGWACGGWLHKNPLPPQRSIWSLHEQLKVEESSRIHDLISTLELPLHSQTVEWKLKYLYEGCLDMDNINVDKATPLKRIISELGGWYILRNWNLQDFDRNSIIKQLHVKYGVSPYFRVSVQRNPSRPGSYSISISPSGLGLPERFYYYTNQNNPIQIAYKQLIRDVVLLFDISTKTDAQKFGEDMFSYEKRIAEITPHLYENINPVNTNNPIKISELKITVSSLPLQDILTAMFPEFNVTEETEVIVTSPHYLTEVSHIATSTDSETLNSYLIWTLVREYLPYLSTEFTSTLSLYEGEVYGFQKPKQRWERCTDLVRNIMGLAVESALEQKHPIYNTTKETVKTIFEEICNSVKKRLSKMQISAPLYKHLSYKLSKLQLQIGLPSVSKNSNYIKDYYNKLMILKASLFDSTKNSLFFKRRIEEKLLVTSHPQDNLITNLITHFDQVIYVASSNTVIVPRTILTASEFENEFPSSVLYGRLGVKLAEAVISSILPFESVWTADLKLLSPYHLLVNESYEAISNTRNCLANFIINRNLAFKTNTELTISTLKRLLAISVAHQALNTYEEGREHIHQPSLEKLEESGVFFLTYAESQCSISTEQQDMYDNVVGYILAQKSLLEAAWWFLPEFSNAFDCNMKKEERCGDMF